MQKHDEVREELIHSDDEFRRLYEEHQDRERRLDELVRCHSTSAQDEIELKALKIQKLHLKDRMEEMIRSRLDGGRVSA
ncbi:MAG TPA: YdcH family protein [Thermoanaerobaculia bacterium]|nr:YdcH family protein [Thermoanaerobaculia bacterium]